MNNEDILRMAKEAGFSTKHVEHCGTVIQVAEGYLDLSHRLYVFLALVQAATAEECAKVCEDSERRRARGLRTMTVPCSQAIRTKYQDQTKSSGEAKPAKVACPNNCIDGVIVKFGGGEFDMRTSKCPIHHPAVQRSRENEIER